MSTSTKRRARQKTPQAVTTTTLSCEVCHIAGDETTLRNWGTESLPYWMCTKTADCDARAWGAHADPPPQPEPEAAVAEETAEVSQ